MLELKIGIKHIYTCTYLVDSHVQNAFKIRLSRDIPEHPGQVVPGVSGTCPAGVPGRPGRPGNLRDIPGTLVPGNPGTRRDIRDMSPVPNIVNYRNHAGADFPHASLHFGASGLGPASLDSSVAWLWTCSFSPISIGVGENRSHRKKSGLKL